MLRNPSTSIDYIQPPKINIAIKDTPLPESNFVLKSRAQIPLLQLFLSPPSRASICASHVYFWRRHSHLRFRPNKLTVQPSSSSPRTDAHSKR